ncbi:hypothetical protein HETIRDRAFT_53544, partial [Heterobasidion irregulare TC 32-1]
SLYLSRFDFTLSYKAGLTNHSDALSRHPDLSEGVEFDNKAQILLPAKLFNKSSKTEAKPNQKMHVKSMEIISLDFISLIQHLCSEHNTLMDMGLTKLLQKGL